MKKYFNECKTKQEAKKLFRQLAKQYHPDVNKETDTTEIMTAIIAEYEIVHKKLPSERTDNNEHENETEEEYTIRISAEMKEILDNISHLPIDIEIIGTWIWISGNTYPYKSYLTAYNFTWCSKKKMYAWHNDPKRKRYGKTKDINEIRTTYGSTKVNNNQRAAIA